MSVAEQSNRSAPIGSRTSGAMPSGRLFAIAFSVIAVTHVGFLTMPASQDATWSVFAAAETLATTGFDYGSLLSQPGFQDGGAATHATSVVTAVTAGVFWVFGTGDAGRVTLHLLHMLIGAAGVVAWMRIGEFVVSSRRSAQVMTLVVFAPLMFTQMAFMYLEIPLFAAAGGALLSYLRGRRRSAFLLAVVAALVKPTGIVVAGAIVATALVDGRRHARWALATAAACGALVMAVTSQEEAATTIGGALQLDFTRHLWRTGLRYTATTLDVAVPLLLLVPALPWLVRKLVHEREPAMALLATFVAMFVGVMVAGPGAGFLIVLLPRYWTLVLPALLFLLFAWVDSDDGLLPARFVWSLLIAIMAVGYFWVPVPSDQERSSFPAAERSPALRELLELERDAIEALLEADATPLVWRDTDFRMRFAGAGFVDTPSERHISMPSLEPFVDIPDHVVFIERDGRRTHTLHRDQLGEGWDLRCERMESAGAVYHIVEAVRSDTPVVTGDC